MATNIFLYLFFFSFTLFVRAHRKLQVLSTTTLPLASVNSLSKNPKSSWNNTVNDNARLIYLSSLAVARRPNKVLVPIAYNKLLSQYPTYVVQIQIGRPAQKLLMAIDTVAGVALVPCSSSSSAYNTAKSTTFKAVNCNEAQCHEVCHQTCGRTSKDPCVFSSTYRESSFSAKLVQDNIILGLNDSIPKYAFGCITTDTGTSIPTQGMLGLGRQSLSLLSQTTSLYNSTFSYCLPKPNTKKYFSGSLTLGTKNQPNNIKTTPLIRSSNKLLHLVNLTGIMVGKKVLNISRSDKVSGTGTGIGIPTVIDSGTVYSVLVGPAYIALRKEIQHRMNKTRRYKLGGFDTCYKNKLSAISRITLMFPGMNFILRQENFLICSSDNITCCLAMRTMRTNDDTGFNVIGSFQQQNNRILFDIHNSRIGVQPENCG